ncbi:MAG: hypothetical protein LKJ86_03730 [Oscillibacter sp.]|jgi:hypothetical protein|nr:hypothetical protein [Oscillibacter sp.]
MLDEKDLQAIAQLMNQQTAKINLTIENEIRPQLRALAEGQKTVLKKLDDLTPKSKTEQLEDQLEMMKQVIKLHSQEIAELKKAQ